MSTSAVTAATLLGDRWSRAERVRLGGIASAVTALHTLGWTLYLYWNQQPVAAGGFAGAGILAYAPGEVTLLSLSASTASAGALPVVALLTLPLLFASGMAAMDTADSLLMTRAYSWLHRSPARRLYYNLATTAMTVLVGGFVASVYLAGLLAEHVDRSWLNGYATIADHFEQPGYGFVGLFALSWLTAVAIWRLRGYDRGYADLSAITVSDLDVLDERSLISVGER